MADAAANLRKRYPASTARMFRILRNVLAGLQRLLDILFWRKATDDVLGSHTIGRALDTLRRAWQRRNTHALHGSRQLK